MRRARGSGEGFFLWTNENETKGDENMCIVFIFLSSSYCEFIQALNFDLFSLIPFLKLNVCVFVLTWVIRRERQREEKRDHILHTQFYSYERLLSMYILKCLKKYGCKETYTHLHSHVYTHTHTHTHLTIVSRDMP